MPIYTLSLKVERKPQEKVLLGQTRAFMAGDVAFQVAAMTVCADANRIIKEHPASLMTYAINPHGPEWGQMVMRLRKHPNLIATDASNWDFSQQIFMIMKACEQDRRWVESFDIRDLSGEYKLGEHWRELYEKFSLGTGVSYIVFRQTVYLALKMIRSGNFKTTQFNCLINALSWRLVFVILMKKNRALPRGTVPMEFYSDNVEEAYVGDDCVLSVSNLVAPWFNQKTAAPVWLEVLGIKLTDAGKGAITQLFTPWDEVRLIKRAFVYRNGWWFAPLPEQVIREMCMWCSDPAFEASIVTSTCTSATLEAAHHGKDFYDEICATLAKACVGRVPFRPISYEACVGNFVS
jgi:hypothetical protein